MAHACLLDHLVGQRHVSLVVRRQVRDHVRPIVFGSVLHRVAAAPAVVRLASAVEDGEYSDYDAVVVVGIFRGIDFFARHKWVRKFTTTLQRGSNLTDLYTDNIQMFSKHDW